MMVMAPVFPEGLAACSIATIQASGRARGGASLRDLLQPSDGAGKPAWTVLEI